jgi:glycosyltransferase involved in cell wall biosynthesis
VFFVPSGTYFGSYHPNAGMSRNMLIFDKNENRRYGFSWLRLKFFILNLVQKKAFYNNDLIIFISNYAKTTVQTHLKRDLSGMPIINHGINSKFVKEPRIQRPISEFSSDRPFNLLYVSPITVYKHQWILVRAVARLREEGYPVVLDLAGGSYSPSYQKYNAELANIKDHNQFIRYHGVVPYAEIEKLYKHAEGFVYCSTCENMPNILIEAMTSGLPICCSNYMPMPEFLGESDFYFDPTNEESVYKALKRFLQNDILRQKNAQASFERAKKYSWDDCAQKTFSVLFTIAKPTKYDSE